MFETKKIDTFFSGEKNLLDEEEDIFVSRRMKVVRFLKLFLPCLTAMLLGLGVALFDFETDNDTAIGIAEDEKIYFEKFRMKNTVFEITEKDNQLSILRADIVEEIDPGKKLYDLVNPDAKTYDKGRVITLVAQKGRFDQNKQELTLTQDVITDYNKQMEIKTPSATYNFAKEYGYGNEKITGNGIKGSFSADKFNFSKISGEINFIENVFMQSQDVTLRTPTKATLFMNDNKFIAQNATIVKNKDKLVADIVTAYFKDMRSFEVTKMTSNGHTQIYSEGKVAYADRGEYFTDTGIAKLFDNVQIENKDGYTATADEGIYDANTKIFTLLKNVRINNKDGYNALADKGLYDLTKKTFTLTENVKIDRGTNVITAPKAIYFAAQKEFRFYDDVVVTQDDCVAKAKSGVYFIKKNIAELEHNVVISKDGNVVRGDKAISDFNTSKSRLIAKNGGRISGKLIENSLKDK